LGHVYVNATLIGEKGRVDIPELMVDTGMTLTVLEPALLHQIGATQRPNKVSLELGDGKKVEAEEYVLDIIVEGRKGSTFALTFQGAKPVLGVVTMELLGLKVDPSSGKIEAARPPGVAYYY
jgi:predicted aspartyl protease